VTVALPAPVVSSSRSVAGPARAVSQQPAVGAPWDAVSFGVVAGLHVIAVGLLLTAWYGASTRADPGSQIAWLNLGVVAVMVSGTANAVWLLIGRRSVAVRLRRATTRLQAALAHDEAADVAVSDGAGAALVRVTAAGQRLSHEPSCPLVRGRESRPATPDQPTCGVCLP
jgi:hypothetical protein